MNQIKTENVISCSRRCLSQALGGTSSVLGVTYFKESPAQGASCLIFSFPSMDLPLFFCLYC